MKVIAYCITALLSFFQLSLYAQEETKTNDLALHLNWSHVGLSSTLDYSINKPKTSFYAGIKYHINKNITDNQQFAFRHRFYAQNFYESFGVSAGLRRYFNLNNSSLTPYFTFNLHASRIGLRNDILTLDTIVTVVQSGTNPPQYITTIVPAYKYAYTDPFITLEGTVGIGLLVKAYKNLYISQSVSLGVATHFQRSDPTDPYAKPTIISYDPCDLYRIGIVYRFQGGGEKQTR